MAAPASEDLRELSRLLVIAGETGEPREFATLQGELGLGHDDLAGALNTLRENGKAEELAPGMWTAPLEADSPAPRGPLRVVAPTPGEVAEGEPATVAATGGPAYSEVRLTMGIAQTLAAEVLGQLVKSGIDEAAENGCGFVFEVAP